MVFRVPVENYTQLTLAVQTELPEVNCARWPEQTGNRHWGEEFLYTKTILLHANNTPSLLKKKVATTNDNARPCNTSRALFWQWKIQDNLEWILHGTEPLNPPVLLWLSSDYSINAISSKFLSQKKKRHSIFLVVTTCRLRGMWGPTVGWITLWNYDRANFPQNFPKV